MFGRRQQGQRFQMRERLVSFGDDYHVKDDDGHDAYFVDGKALRMRKTLDLQDGSGNTLLRIQTHVMHVHHTMVIEGPDGQKRAEVRKALITPIRERFKVEIEGGDDFDVHGNVVEHEYEIKQGHDEVASVSKKWLHVADTYGIEVAEGADVPLVLAVAVAIDELAHPDR